MKFNSKLTNEENKIVRLAALGGMLEFYDFIIYGIFTIYFSEQFFPSSNHFLSILQSYLVFIVGYFVRPIGGVIFSHIGDEYGRKKVLVITILLMGLSSLGIGVIPVYSQIGVLAPIMLVIFRVIQGLAAGGEIPSTYVYISERIKDKQEKSFGFVLFGINSGLLLGMIINLLLNKVYTEIELNNFAWRIPFLIGGILCLLSFKVRKILDESKVFKQEVARPKLPLVYLFKNLLKETIASILLIATMAFYMTLSLVFMPSYLKGFLHVSTNQISYIMIIAILVHLVTILILRNFINYKKFINNFKMSVLISFVLTLISFYLLYVKTYYLGVSLLGLISGVFALQTPLTISNLFPSKVRLTGLAVSYNIGFAIFGGLSPLIVTSATNYGLDVYLAPLMLLMLGLVLNLFGLKLLKNKIFN